MQNLKYPRYAPETSEAFLLLQSKIKHKTCYTLISYTVNTFAYLKGSFLCPKQSWS